MQIKRPKRNIVSLLFVLCAAWLFTVSALAETPAWVQETDREVSPAAGIINYVSDDGTTAAEIRDNEITWLREESEGGSTWYGIDNRNGEFKSGSRFWIRWISMEEDPGVFEKCLNTLDGEMKRQLDRDHLRLFLFGVTDPEGNEYRRFSGSVPLYIQLGSEFDREDLMAMFVSDGMDEQIAISFTETLSPEGRGNFAAISIPHAGTALLGEGSSGFLASVIGEGNGHVLLVIFAMLVLIGGVLLRYRAEKRKEKEKNACDIVVMKRRYGEDGE